MEYHCVVRFYLVNLGASAIARLFYQSKSFNRICDLGRGCDVIFDHVFSNNYTGIMEDEKELDYEF